MLKPQHQSLFIQSFTTDKISSLFSSSLGQNKSVSMPWIGRHHTSAKMMLTPTIAQMRSTAKLLLSNSSNLLLMRKFSTPTNANDIGARTSQASEAKTARRNIPPPPPGCHLARAAFVPVPTTSPAAAAATARDSGGNWVWVWARGWVWVWV